MSTIQDNLNRVRERIAAALERAGRAGEAVTVVGVTKTFGPEMVDEVVRAGIKDVGENRLQEFLAKREHVKEDCRWHLIGHLQGNKATKAIGRFHLVHSVDSVKIAQTLDRLGRERGVVTQCLLHVNTSHEGTKHGFSAEELVECAAAIGEMPHLNLEGLMTIGPVSMDEEETRGCFRTLYRLREEASRALNRELEHLSMGMSGDFEMAVEEGATILRLGTILTGPRQR